MHNIPEQLSHDLLSLSQLVGLSLSPEVILSSQPMLLFADVLEQPDHLLIRMNLPGARPENIIVTFVNNTLSVAAKLEPSLETTNYLWRERPSGEVFRSIVLIGELEMCSGCAFLEFGVLTIRVNKATSHVIPVYTGAYENDCLSGALVQTDFAYSTWY
jgi:HSP20 family molecular chaperone IbpA